MIIHGDSLNVLREMEDNSIDAVVTDPPYGLGETSPAKVAECLQAWAAGETWTPTGRGFMNKSWDAWVPPPELWREVYRVLKHGGHALVFASSRTQDLMSISLRLAGFEVRDTLQWLYGSGFPKSHNVSLSIDKLVVNAPNRGRAIPSASQYQASDTEQRHKLKSNPVGEYQALSDEGEQWRGWGTALKPAYEPVLLVRKPLMGTVAQNILEFGTGGLNIDATRIPLQEGESTYVEPRAAAGQRGSGGWKNTSEKTGSQNRDCDKGRWPANVLLDEEAALALDEQSGERVSGSRKAGVYTQRDGVTYGHYTGSSMRALNSSSGGASRFYYCSKTSVKEREAGLEGFTPKSWSEQGFRDNQSSHLSPRAGAGRTGARKNHHPTVKPIELMRYLCRLITPPDGVVLDPFCGSGSTLCAASMEGFRFIGIEREEEYVQIAQARVAHWEPEPEPEPEPETTDYSDLPLFREGDNDE